MTDEPDHRIPHLTDVDGNPIEMDDAIARAFQEAASSGEPVAPLSMWWTLSRPDGGGISMRLTLKGRGRWTLTDVYMHGTALTATDLQTVPVTDLDLLLNLTHDFDGFDPWTAAEAYNEMAEQAGWSGSVLVVDHAEQDDPLLSDLRERAVNAPPELPKLPGAERPRLTRPDGTDPDGFAARVAAAYREYATQTRAPAVEMAKEADVPIATVRSWIREARRRGKLPQGRKGKAG
jgi:hypothetical protein